MQPLKISQLPQFSGDSSGSYVLINDSSNSVTYIIRKEDFLSGSLYGTASYALNSDSSSYSFEATSASYSFTASYIELAQTASFVTSSNVYGPYGSDSVLSSSYALTASYALNAGSGVSIFPYTGSAAITGSLPLEGRFSQFGDQVFSDVVPVRSYAFVTESIAYVNYSSSGLEQVWNSPTSYDTFEIALPFTHSFLGQDYTSIYFSTPQYFTLGSGYVDYNPGPKNPPLPGYRIASVYDTNFELWTGSLDSGQTFQIYVVAAEDNSSVSPTRAYTFRIVSGSGEIELHFERMLLSVYGVTSGVADGQQTSYLLDLAPSIVDGTDYAFKIVPQSIDTPTPLLSVSGSISVRDTMYGTASWAQNSLGPITYDPSLSTLYSVQRDNDLNVSNYSNIFLGTNSGDSSNNNGSIVIGEDAGQNSTINNSIAIGHAAGANAYFPYTSIFIGDYAGAGSNTNTNLGSIAIGYIPLGSSDYVSDTISIGNYAGYNLDYAVDSVFIGKEVASRSRYVSGSVMIGLRTGVGSLSSSYSVILGHQAGVNPFGFGFNPSQLSIGENNIIIGTNISLDLGRRDSINIGGIIFGTGSYFDSTYFDENTSPWPVFSGSAGGKIGINQPYPQYTLDVSGSVYASQGFTGSLYGSASYALTASYALNGGGGGGTPGGSNTQIQYNNSNAFGGVPTLTYNGTTLRGTGSFSGSFTGALTGTASWAAQASTASFVTTAQTASFVTTAQTASFVTASNVYGPFGSNSVISASYALSSSYSVTSSFAMNVTPDRIYSGSVTASVNIDTASFQLTSASIQMLFVSNSGLIVGQRMSLSSSQDISSGSTLVVYGSGSLQPVFTVQGSQGELFSVNDSLSGSLFSVNDISGLPIIEAFSDNRVFIGSNQAPALFTTVKTTMNTGSNIIYQNISTASYDAVFYEYSLKSGSNSRVGSIMGAVSESVVNYTEVVTTDFGNTSGVKFMVMVTGSNIALTGSATTGNWTMKAIVRSI